MNIIDFKDYPRQFLISKKNAASSFCNAHLSKFCEYNILADKNLPIIDLIGEKGNHIGKIIGYCIFDEKVLDHDSEISIDEFELFYKSTSGKYAIIYEDEGEVFFRLDPNGFLPAVFCSFEKVIASTTTLMNNIIPLERNEEVISIFNFPEHRGFLPFGLTSCINVERLLPDFDLNLKTWEVKRTWPTQDFCSSPLIEYSEVPGYLKKIYSRVRGNVKAIVDKGYGYLFLSGGHDSRMVLAACKDFKRKIICDTISNNNTPDFCIAEKITKEFDIKHNKILIENITNEERKQWLVRTGYTFYDPLTELSKTAQKNERNNFTMDGTGAELCRASNWMNEDLESTQLNINILLKRLRMPNNKMIREAAENWIRTLPVADTTLALDISKIEIIHACWAGVGIYGHLTKLPTLSPFSGRMISEIALKLPKNYKFTNQVYYDYIKLSWPELLMIPANEVKGFEKLKYIKHQIKKIIPTKIKRIIKPLR